MGCRIDYCPFGRGKHCLKCQHYISPCTEYSKILEKALLKVEMLNATIILAHPRDLKKFDMDMITEDVYFVETPLPKKGTFLKLLGNEKEQVWKDIQSGKVPYKQGRRRFLQ